jgi:phosphoglycolate phosphatase
MIDNYQHIIWDWNGTLLDDMSLNLAIVNDMLRDRGLAALTVERYREVFTFPIRDYYENIGFDFSRESYEQLSLRFVATYRSRWHEIKLFPQARRILEQIQASGKTQSVLSAHQHDTLSEFVGTFSINHLFQHLIGLENTYAHSKVDQGRGLLAMLPHPEFEVVLVGDTLHDAEVAEAMGVNCVLVGHGHQSKERLQQCGVPVVDALSALLD